jgi:2'-5' RNA ligase
MRLFIGIPLAAEVIDELSAIVARHRRREDGLRWAAPETWHITLQFLGDTSPEQYKCIAPRLGELRSPPVPVRLGDLGFFDRTGVFFAGVQVTPQLLALHQSVIAATSRCGFVPESRLFHPHITLARAKGKSSDQGSATPATRPEGTRRSLGTPAGVRDQSGLTGLKGKVQLQHRFSCFNAAEFNLYESFLGPGGSRYEIRERFLLN